MHHLRFRQVHLDFHTSGAISGIGARFDPARWKARLREARVNSITLFSKCHHGWSYHPTSVGRQHPHLGFDLLRAQFDACKAADINAPIYLSAGIDNVASHDHPEWREILANGSYSGWATPVIAPGFHKMCLNSPYLDYLCAQIDEAVALFPSADGVFLDITSQGQCCCRWCLDSMERENLDAACEEDRTECARRVLDRYYRATTAACRARRAEMPVFQNSGHINRGDRQFLQHVSHLELESLPTGGWGYDHFPLSAKYCGQLGIDFLGMTGKFHSTWGEFGGYKHPNALRYECAAMLAFGSKCSVGDQLHPTGELDASTYEIIGAAYREVEQKEPWCEQTRNVADLALLSSAAVARAERHAEASDVGACRVLLETHALFDVIDAEAEFGGYRVLVLPDDVPIGRALQDKLDGYLTGGGKLLLTGASGLSADGTRFLFDLGADYFGPSEFSTDYVLPAAPLGFVHSPLVMYLPSQRIKATRGQSFGQVFDPYFNRTFRHFSSHQHTPPRPDPSGYDCGVRHGPILYLAHPIFSIYRGTGGVAYKDYAAAALAALLGDERTLRTNLPSTARVTLMHQPAHGRYILHLLYGATASRGGEMHLAGGNVPAAMKSVEVIEDLPALHGVRVSLRLPEPVRRVTLEPEGRELAFTGDGARVELELAAFSCHAMIVLHVA